MMKKNRKNIHTNKTTAILVTIAAALLIFSAVGSTQAALTYYSETYSAQFEMYDIGVTLVENGRDISYRDYTQSDDVWYEESGELVKYMIPEGEQLQLGRAYQEELTVRNSGTIDEYVRVMVYRYWEDGEGNRRVDLSPELIELNFMEENGWIIDDNATTAERTVLYYDKILLTGQTAPLFNDTLRIDPEIAKHVEVKKTETEEGKTKITMTYKYQDVRFVIEADVDAVQTHNARDAIKSAWGVDVEIGADGSLSLKE